MTTLWISACSEGVDRQRADLRSKLDHADVASTGNAVSPLLSRHWRGINREHSALITVDASDGKTRPGVVKLLLFAFIDTLQTAEFTPRNFPGAEISLERGNNVRKVRQLSFWRGRA